MTRLRTLRGAAVGAAAAAVLAAALAAPTAAQTAVADEVRDVLWIRVAGWTLPDLLDRPAVARLAAVGGAAVAPPTALLGTTVDVGDPDRLVRERLAASAADRVLVIVVGTVPADGVALVPVVVAEGHPAALLDAGEGPPRALASASTHRDGVVTAGDVIATANAFWGGGIPADAAVGAALRPTDAAAPLGLHRRFVERATSLGPVGAVAGVLATMLGLAVVAALAARRRVPPAVLRALAWAALGVPGLALSLLLAGHLPVLTSAPVLAAVAVGSAAVLWLGGRRGASAAPTTVGAVVLLGFALEAATGWRGQLLAFLGASLLDGGRFYGMSNAFIGLLVGAAVLVAWRLPRRRALALLVATGVFAGFPMLGSNVGGATTAFAAAGLWWGIGRRGRLDPVALLLAGALTLAGIALVFAAHALWPTATHVDGAIAEGTGVVGHYVERLRIGARMLREHPLAVIPALGAPILLGLVLRPPAVFADGFASEPGSRQVVLVLALASLVAYVANDSGAAAAGLTWGVGLVLAFWVSLRAASARMTA